MPNYFFERECRTPYSECYTIIEGERPVGRIDLHYTPTAVHATLCVGEGLTQEEIQELIEIIDEELVDVLGVHREDFIVHVHQGQDLGVFSNSGFSEDSEGEL